MITIIQTDFALSQYFEEDKLVQINWKKVPKLSLEDYQMVIIKSLEFQEQHPGKVLNFLSDIRDQGILSPEYRKWFQDVAVPRTVKNGLKMGAVLFDGNVFQKYYLNNILNFTKTFGIKFKFFSKREEAIEFFRKG